MSVECIAIATSPVSASALLGEDARFSCVGRGPAFLWLVNGINAKNLLGAHSNTTVVEGGVVASDLSITATVENDNASVQCLLIAIGDEDNIISDPAYLTVLGELRNSQTYTCETMVMVYVCINKCVCINMIYQTSKPLKAFPV